jgi:hypothetical protein
MGTSKSNSGLRPNTPLLPDYAPPPEPLGPPKDEENPKEKPKTNEEEPQFGNWSNAKSALTSVVKAGSSAARKTKISGAARNYVAGSGGSAAIRKSAIGGRAVGRNLGRVLFSIITSGASSAFEQEGLGDLTGQSTEVAFAKLAKQLSSRGGTVEETIANIAVVEALAYIYDEFDLATNDLSKLDSLTESQAKEVIQVYVTTYIFERWLHELGVKIENTDLSELQVVQLESEIKDFIMESVKLKFDNLNLKSIDFNQGEGKRAIDEIFNQAYKMIE